MGSVSGKPESTVVESLRAAGCVFAEDEARLLVAEAGTPERLAEMVDLRGAGLPLEHVLGWAEFCGLRIEVDPGVFVPRRRTKLLVEQAIELARRAGAGAGAAPTLRPVVVLDMCCGSGAVGVALSTALGGAELSAVDVDPAAVRCARRNVATLGGQVYEGDLYAPLPHSLRGRVDLLVVNAPYVPTDSLRLMPAEARLYEPRAALDGGEDGLDIQRRVIAAAPPWLAPGGHLLVETSVSQSPDTGEAFVKGGFDPRVVTSDAVGGTVVIGTRRGRR